MHTEQAWAWARAVIETRALALPTPLGGSGAGALVIAPLIDMANHAQAAQLEVVADDPLSRSLLTSSLHRARHAVIESLRRALAPHGGGGVRMRGSVTEYTR